MKQISAVDMDYLLNLIDSDFFHSKRACYRCSARQCDNEFLASVFAVDSLTYTVMSNDIHSVLRSRPDVLESRNVGA